MERTKDTDIFQDLFAFLKKWWFSILMIFVMGLGILLICLGNILDDTVDCIFMSLYGFGVFFIGFLEIAFDHVCSLLSKSSAEADKNKNENKE